MKKFGKNVLAGIFAIFIGCFSSCNLISSDGDSSGSFEFSVSSNLARKVSSKASVLSQDAGSDQSQEKFIIKVDVSGDYQTQVSKEYTMEQWERVMSGLETVTFTIDNIPVSSVIKVKVKVIFALPDWERLILVGESDQITVKEGSNPLNIVLSDAPSDSSGSILIDNGVVTITVDKTEVKQNGRISFTSKDSSGSAVTLESFYAQILYKGQDVNNLVTGKSYYDISNNSIKLDASCPLPAGIYQLYISATYKGLSSSQTFEITVKDEFETPETQVALYEKSGSTYSYCLTDSSSAGTFTPSTFSSRVNSFAFDAAGNFYTANYNSTEPYATIKSNNPVIGSGELALSMTNSDGSDCTYYFKDFVVDLATNTAYACGVNGQSVYLFKYPSLISNKSMTDVVLYNSSAMNVENFTASKISVNNNILYVYGNVYDVGDRLYIYDISSGTTPISKLTEPFDVTTYITGTLGFSSNATVTDIYALEGAVYILVSDSSVWTSADKNIYKRGSIIQYVPPATGFGSGTASHIPLNTNASYTNTDISKMYLYIASSDVNSWIYSNEGCTTLYSNVIGTKHSKMNDDGALLNTFFPNVYAIKSATEKNFSSPAKVIAIKPKKLVISDDGIAFYTSNDGILSFKNVNRVITIDLQGFVIDSMQSTSAKFDSDISDYLKSNISLNDIRSGATYYDWQTPVWYFDSNDNTGHQTTLTYTSDYISSMFLSIKEDN